MTQLPRSYVPYCREWQRLDRRTQRRLVEATPSYPVRLTRVAAAFDLTMVYAALPSKVSGEIRRDDREISGFRIAINRFESRQRQRFTAAHEISHFILHREVMGDAIQDNVMYRSVLGDYLEAQANRLASNILIPHHLIQQFQTHFPDLKDDNLIDVAANEFQTSRLAMKFRLGV